jgi:hypothetical protein
VLGAVAVLAMTAVSGAAAPRVDPSDIVQIYQLQANFDRATSTKNLDLMMSLWYDYATLSTGGPAGGYEGKNQIRGWFATSAGAFRPENHRAALTPTPKIRIEVRGNQASLSFESHYVDLATKALKAEVTVNATLARIKGKWLITDAIFSSPPAS